MDCALLRVSYYASLATIQSNLFLFIHVLFLNMFFSYCRLRQLDIEFMKRLHKKVNFVPVIAKADVLTRAETKRLKENMMKDIRANHIEVSY